MRRTLLNGILAARRVEIEVNFAMLGFGEDGAFFFFNSLAGEPFFSLALSSSTSTLAAVLLLLFCLYLSPSYLLILLLFFFSTLVLFQPTAVSISSAAHPSCFLKFTRGTRFSCLCLCLRACPTFFFLLLLCISLIDTWIRHSLMGSSFPFLYTSCLLLCSTPS